MPRWNAVSSACTFWVYLEDDSFPQSKLILCHGRNLLFFNGLFITIYSVPVPFQIQTHFPIRCATALFASKSLFRQLQYRWKYLCFSICSPVLEPWQMLPIITWALAYYQTGDLRQLISPQSPVRWVAKQPYTHSWLLVLWWYCTGLIVYW